jgi:hypothetical protein
VPRLGGVQLPDAGFRIRLLQKLRCVSLAEEADALLAAGHLQQFAVEHRVPVPGQARASAKAALKAGRWPSRSVSASVPSTSKIRAYGVFMGSEDTRAGALAEVTNSEDWDKRR